MSVNQETMDEEFDDFEDSPGGLLEPPSIQDTNFGINFVTRELVHDITMGPNIVQDVVSTICFELDTMIREGNSSEVKSLVKWKKELQMITIDESHVFL
ncbi:hypothetical protein V6N13_130162 [Hibiscus sabdariffa]|uniref:Uncharacterized protein n=1 Tax=Hibiscus sabdariffa TaxID=183260 RepID=A0ABR2SN63_9ROSI